MCSMFKPNSYFRYLNLFEQVYFLNCRKFWIRKKDYFEEYACGKKTIMEVAIRTVVY